MSNQPSLPLVSAVQPEYQPTAIPTQISSGVADVDGKSMVVMQISSATGVHMTFLPPEMARAVARNLEASARSADSGLIVPSRSFEPGAVDVLGEAQLIIGRANGQKESS